MELRVVGPAFYFPVLRAKSGEFDALAHLSEHARLRTAPILDVPRPEEDSKGSTRDYHAHICEQLSRTWGTANPIYLDLSRYSVTEFAKDQGEIVDHLFLCARQGRLKAIPVAGPPWFRGLNYLKAVSSVAMHDGWGLALRMPGEDFQDVETLRARMDECVSVLDMTAGMIDLVLDFEAIARLTKSDQVDLALVNAAAAAMRTGHERGFRRLILCGSSIPDAVGVRKVSQRTEFERRELATWRRLVEVRPDLV